LQAQDKLNFVFIIADDVGWNDIGCYGNKVVKTPNIDKLASEGLRFTNAFLTASSCSPSRCSIISGKFFRCCMIVLHGAIWLKVNMLHKV